MEHFDKIRERLRSSDLDAVLLNCEANRFYACGMHASDEEDGAVIVTEDGAYFFTDSRYIEAARQTVRGARIEEVRMGRGYGTLISEVIERHGIKRMGFDEEHLTVSRFEQCRKFCACVLVPASELLTALRIVKSEEEISCLISAQRIAERALAELLNDIRPGVTERELAARLTYLMLLYGAEDTSFDPIVVSGENSSKPHGMPSDRRLCDGDFVTMDFGALYNGYCSDMTRTVAVGHATEEMQRVYDTVLRAQLAGIAAARAGVSACSVDMAARDVITAEGYGEYFGHSFGHGVGIEIHEAPNVSPRNESPLPAGAVVSAEPGIYLPGRFGVRIEDVLVITENGCDDITKADKKLLIR